MNALPIMMASPIKYQCMLPVSLLNCFTVPTSKGGIVPGCQQSNELLLSLPVNARGADFMGRLFCPIQCRDNILQTIVAEDLDPFGTSFFESTGVRFIITSFTLASAAERSTNNETEESYFVSLCSGSQSNLVSKVLDVETIKDAVAWFGKQWDPKQNDDLEEAFRYLIEDVMMKEPALNGCNEKGLLVEFIKSHEWLAVAPDPSLPIWKQRQFIQDNIALQTKIVGSPCDGQHRTVGFKICCENLNLPFMNPLMSQSITTYALTPHHIQNEVQTSMTFQIPISTVTPAVCEKFRHMSAEVQKQNASAKEHGIFMYLRMILDDVHHSLFYKMPGLWLLPELEKLFLIIEDSSVEYWIGCNRDRIKGQGDPENLTKSRLTITVKASPEGGATADGVTNKLNNHFQKFAEMTRKKGMGGTDSRYMQEYFRIIWRMSKGSATLDKMKINVQAAVPALIHAWTETIMACIYNALNTNRRLLPQSLILFKAGFNWDNVTFEDFCVIVSRNERGNHGKDTLFPVPLLSSSSQLLGNKILKDMDVRLLDMSGRYTFYEPPFRSKKCTDSMVDLVQAVLLAFHSKDSFSNTTKFVTNKSLLTEQVLGSSLVSELKSLRFFIHMSVSCASRSSSIYTASYGFFVAPSRIRHNSRMRIKDVIPVLFLLPQALHQTGSFLNSFGLNPCPQSYEISAGDLKASAKSVAQMFEDVIKKRGDDNHDVRKEITEGLTKFLNSLFPEVGENIDFLTLNVLFFLVFHLEHVVLFNLNNVDTANGQDLVCKVVTHSVYQSLGEVLVEEDRARTRILKPEHEFCQGKDEAIKTVVNELLSKPTRQSKTSKNFNAITDLTVNKDTSHILSLDSQDVINDLSSIENKPHVTSRLDSITYMVPTVIRSHPDHPLVTNIINEWYQHRMITDQKENVAKFLVYLCLKYTQHDKFKLIGCGPQTKKALKYAAELFSAEFPDISKPSPPSKERKNQNQEEVVGNRTKKDGKAELHSDATHNSDEGEQSPPAKRSRVSGGLGGGGSTGRSSSQSKEEEVSGGLSIEDGPELTQDEIKEKDKALTLVYNNQSVKKDGEQNKQTNQQTNDLSKVDSCTIRSKQKQTTTEVEEDAPGTVQELNNQENSQEKVAGASEAPRNAHVKEWASQYVKQILNSPTTEQQQSADEDSDQAEENAHHNQEHASEHDNDEAEAPSNQQEVFDNCQIDMSASILTNFLTLPDHGIKGGTVDIDCQSLGTISTSSGVKFDKSGVWPERPHFDKDNPDLIGQGVRVRDPNGGDPNGGDPNGGFWEENTSILFTEEQKDQFFSGIGSPSSFSHLLGDDTPNDGDGFKPQYAEEDNVGDQLSLPLPKTNKEDAHARAMQLLHNITLTPWQDRAQVLGSIEMFLDRHHPLHRSNLLHDLKNGQSVNSLINRLLEADQANCYFEHKLTKHQGPSNACTMISLLLSISVIQNSHIIDSEEPARHLDVLTSLVTNAIKLGKDLWGSENAKNITGYKSADIGLGDGIKFLDEYILLDIQFEKEIADPVVHLFRDTSERNKVFMKFNTESEYAAMCINHGNHTYTFIKLRNIFYCIETMKWNDGEPATIRCYREIHQLIIHMLLKAFKRPLLDSNGSVNEEHPCCFFDYFFIESEGQKMEQLNNPLHLASSIKSWLDNNKEKEESAPAGATDEEAAETEGPPEHLV